MLGGAGAAPSVGTPPPVQPGKAATTQKVVTPRALAATTTVREREVMRGHALSVSTLFLFWLKGCMLGQKQLGLQP